MAIRLKNPVEIEKIRRSSQAASIILQHLGEAVQAGVATAKLDQLSRRMIREMGGISSFLGYQPHPHPPFPGTICASINEEVVHGIPSKHRTLRDGDIIGIDIAIRLDGYHGDNAFTFPVGAVSSEARRLIDATKTALYRAIDVARPGNRIGDVGYAVQRFVEAQGFSVVRELCGHGIGQRLWEEPQVPNYGEPGRGVRLKPGMVIAVEPMVCAGAHQVAMLDDGWTVITADRSLSAHFEHTIAILSDGPDILTWNEDLWGV